MRRAAQWLLGVLAAAVLLPVVALALLLAALNTGPGRAVLAQRIGWLTGGSVQVSGIGGLLPGRVRVQRIVLRDAGGVWLTVDDAMLDWSPLALLAGTAQVRLLTASRLDIARLPESGGQAAGPSGGGFGLPLLVAAGEVHVGRIDLGAAVAGVPLVASLDGSARLVSLRDGEADILLRASDGSGSYHLRGRIDPVSIQANLNVAEAARGTVARLAHLPELGAITLHVSLDGPWRAAATTVALAAGGLTVDTRGTLDLRARAADLTVAARAPAMAPAPGVSFRDASLQAHVRGRFAAPEVSGTLRVEGLRAAGAAAEVLRAELSGNRGAARLHASAAGLRIPGPHPDLFAADPVALDAQVALSDPRRPVTFTVTHPLLHVQGTAQTAGTITAQARVEAPDLASFAALAGVTAAGHGALDGTVALPGGATELTLDGTLGLTAGPAPAPALLGDAARIGVTASLRGDDVTLSRLAIDGRALRLHASGRMARGRIDATAELTLPDLHAAQPTLRGQARLDAHATGALDDLAAQLRLAGDIATAGMASGHVEARIDVAGLPARPEGEIEASGMLDGAPLNLAAAIRRAADGDVAATIRAANWKSARAEGALTLAAGARLPTGHIALRMARLDDLRRLTGQALTGSVMADMDLARSGGAPVVSAAVRADRAGLPGTASVAHLALDARVADPLGGAPVAQATLVADGVQAGRVVGSARVQASGPQTALAIRAQASGRDVAGGPAQLAAQATLDLPARRLALAALSVTARGQTVRLLAPARLSFGPTVAVDRLRLGLDRAVLELAGRVAPTLDLTASVRNVTGDLARLFDPSLQASGTLSADARLTGTAARPAGTLRLAADGLHLRRGPAAALPPVSISVQATLAGRAAQVAARLAAGSSRLSVTGTAPIDRAAAMNLHAAGEASLDLLDPILTTSGRRLRGHLALDATVTGTLGAPRATGALHLADGDFQDFATGIHVTDIAALIEAAGDRVRIARFAARAGPGTISAEGSVGLAPPMPVDLALAMHNAQPLASDLLTATLDAALSLRGQLHGRLDAGGRIDIRRAEINIPAKLPTSVAVLDVRLPGQQPLPPPAPPPDIGLDLALDAPGQIFLRGRGIDAELSGRLHLGGTLAAPRPSGGFELRRGSISVAGVRLTFSSGRVIFDGSGGFDPLLDLLATSTSGSFTANLQVGGYASDPKITLSSTPPAPQDEVLAHLLFGQSAASLGPFQLAQIAVSLAQLTGTSGGFDPLGTARRALGLDVLSVGGGGTGASVQAGKYIAPGVFVSARQGTSGGGTQAQVQIDMTRRLRLDLSAGTGTSSVTGAGSSASSLGTGLGLSYEFEY